MDGLFHLFFALAACLYAAAFLATLPAIRRGREGLAALCSKATAGLLAAGFAVQIAGFAARGMHLHQCPIASRGDLFGIVAWSAVAMYGISGASARTNLLGFFTSGLAALLAGMALAAGYAPEFPRVDAPVLVHAWLSLFSYGAFALAALAGAMYLLQFRGLRRRRWAGIFSLLPSLAELEAILSRLQAAGFWVYSAAIGAGAAWMLSGDRNVGAVKLVLALLLWKGALAMYLLRKTGHLRGRRLAAAALALFALAIAALYPVGMGRGHVAAPQAEVRDAGR